MKKLALLLDDITIINFGLILKLAQRYTLHLLVAVVVFISLYFKYYYTQPIIFSTNIPMKVMMKQSSRGEDMMAAVKNESQAAVTIGELSATFGSFAFNKTFAGFVIKDKDFENMNLGSIATGKGIKGSEIEKACNKKHDCMIESVGGLIGGLFSIEQGLTEDRFNLTVNSLEKDTVLRLAASLVKAIDKNRIEVRRYSVAKEIESVNSLITETRSYIHKAAGFQKIEDEEKKVFAIQDLKERMRILQTTLSNEMANSSAFEARLSENKKILNEKVSPAEGLVKVEIKEAEKKILEIKNNILAINNISEDKRSDSDKLILAQLQAELNQLESKHSTGESIRTIALKESFSDDQRAKENDYKFESVVSKNKVINLQNDYEKIKHELNSLEKDKTSREAIVSKLKAELDFLKNLESKQVSLKVMNSTLTSDLQFEDFSSSVASFRRSSPLKISMFSFVLTFVAYLFTLVFRYILDTRIYSEDDVALYLTSLEFYGEVPTFE